MAPEKWRARATDLLIGQSQIALGVAGSGCAGFVEALELCDKPDLLCTLNEIKG